MHRLSGDHADIAAIHDALYQWNCQKCGDPFDATIHAPHIDGQQAFVVCDADGGIHGGLAFHRMDGKPGCLFIDYLFLDDAARGHGNGARLMEDFLSWAKANGATAVEVTSNSYQAPQFYQRMGFRITATPPCPVPLYPDNIHYAFRREL